MYTALIQLAQESHAGRLHFGDVIAGLAGLGVESYLADYRAGQSVYYLADGGHLTVSMAMPAITIPPHYDVPAVVDAIRGAQRGDVKYPAFVERTLRAGCVGYHVWIAGRHVVYYGRHGGQHVERFPD